jgi:oligoribonuclease NrnB/cAMP/cGMP phosphodiesterase (DHH superfamily)
MDGICSAAIVNLKYPGIDLMGIDYDDEPDMGKIINYREVIMVDFSLSIENMRRIVKNCDFTYIDHHRDAVESVIKLNSEINCIDVMGCSLGIPAACELTWTYFFNEPVPLAVQLLSLYDTWQHDIDPRCVPFNTGIQVMDHEPRSSLWNMLFSYNLNTAAKILEIIDIGEHINHYFSNMNRKTMQKKLFESYFLASNGTVYRALCFNGGKGSKRFSPYTNPKRHDLCIAFERTKEKWVYHLYAVGDTDVSKIAVDQGGGGHKDAAGFNTHLGPHVFLIAVECDNCE